MPVRPLLLPLAVGMALVAAGCAAYAPAAPGTAATTAAAPSQAATLAAARAQMAQQRGVLAGALDPGALTSFVYEVAMDGQPLGFFQRVSGIGATTEVIEHKTTDPKGNVIIQKIPGQTSVHNVTLEAGFTGALNPLATAFGYVQSGRIQDARKTISIVLYDESYTPVKRWELLQAWPYKYELVAENGTVLERYELAVESYTASAR